MKVEKETFLKMERAICDKTMDLCVYSLGQSLYFKKVNNY